MIIQLSDEATINLTTAPYSTEGLTVTILGNKGMGKSNILAVFAEEAHRNQIPFIYYDPNGDAASLRELGDDVVVIGQQDHEERLRRADYPLAVALRDPGSFVEMALNEGFSFVVDLSDPDDELRLATFTAMVQCHYKMAAKVRRPCFMLVDEAHCFAPQIGADEAERASRRALGRVSTDGRKRGMALVTATQRSTYLDKRIIFSANVRIFGKVTYFPDFRAFKEYLPVSFEQMRSLRSGEVYIVSEKAWGITHIRRRGTTDLGATPAFRPGKNLARPSLKQIQLPFLEA
jgi:DNA helicase HerA-like ATPase